MMINFVKFVHILLAMSLLGFTAYCITLTRSNNRANIQFFNKKLIVLSLFTLITGSLLVYPKHFMFHTAWIQAAYLLVLTYAITLILLTVFSKKIHHIWLWRLLYIALFAILVLITHEAVTKKTVLYFLHSAK
jgi:hypothetical protein